MAINLIGTDGKKYSINLSEERYQEVINFARGGSVPAALMGDLEVVARGLGMSVEQFLSPGK